MIDTKNYSGSGTLHGRHVEVRFRESPGQSPTDCNGVIVSKEWRRLDVAEAQWPVGVRNELWEREWYPHAFSRRLLSAEAAHAIAAMFAAANRRWNFLFEFRFVEEKIEYNFSHSEVRESQPFRVDGSLVPWAGVSTEAPEPQSSAEGEVNER